MPIASKLNHPFSCLTVSPFFQPLHEGLFPSYKTISFPPALKWSLISLRVFPQFTYRSEMVWLGCCRCDCSCFNWTDNFHWLAGILGDWELLLIAYWLSFQTPFSGAGLGKAFLPLGGIHRKWRPVCIQKTNKKKPQKQTPGSDTLFLREKGKVVFFFF